MEENFIVIPGYPEFVTTDRGDFIYKKFDDGSVRPLDFWKDARGRRYVVMPDEKARNGLKPVKMHRLITAAKLGRPVASDKDVCHLNDVHDVETFDTLREGSHKENMDERKRLNKTKAPKRSHETNITILLSRKENGMSYSQIASNMDIDQRIIEDCFGRRRLQFKRQCEKAIEVLGEFYATQLDDIKQFINSLSREPRLTRKRRLRAARERRRIAEAIADIERGANTPIDQLEQRVQLVLAS